MFPTHMSSSQGPSSNFPLTIVLQIFSYLEIDELTELYQSCRFFRVLIHKSRLSPEYSTVGLKEPTKLTWLIEQELQSNNNRINDSRNMGNVVLKYVKAMKQVNEKIEQDKRFKIEQMQQSPTLSTLSKSSMNSLFSDDEWNFSLDESLPSPITKEDPSLHNIEKVNDTMKVREKALLFERLMSQENDSHVPRNLKHLQSNDVLYERFNELQNLILPKSNNTKNITDQYLTKIKESEDNKIYIPKKIVQRSKLQQQSPPLSSKKNFSEKYQRHLESINKPTVNSHNNSHNSASVPNIQRGSIKDLYENKIMNQ